MPAGRPLKFSSAQEIESLADNYFATCKEAQEPITITGLCLALGTFRDVLMDYESGKYDLHDSEYSNAIKRVKLTCENYAEKRLYGNNPTGAIFALKNYGWKDKVEQEHSGEVQLGVQLLHSIPRPERDKDA